ncbi:MAG: SgcJ/EcaC family oxidoreductase, partial [Bryobacterales bacterium]|nr:SgcJ/EcaC family oxidoreductase [Bryobacterales bacterium]
MSSVCLTAADACTEVLGVMHAQQEAWNRGDLDGFLESYEKAGDITFVGREVSRGFDGLVKRYRSTYGDRGRMGQLQFAELEFRPLGEDYALVIGRFQLTRTESAGGNASGRFTVVLHKSVNGWKIIHDHTSPE